MYKKIVSAFATIAVVFSAVAPVATFPLSAGATENVKVNLCHAPNQNSGHWVAETVSQNAIPTHLANGDFVYAGPIFTSGPHEGEPNTTGDAWCDNHFMPKLTVIKTVVGTTTPASAFTLTVSTTTSQSFPGNSVGTVIPVKIGATYSVTEGTYANFTKTLSADCTGTMAVGTTKTCTVTNTYVPPVTPASINATIVGTKIICDNESDLPNWGAGAPADITEATAATFLATHPTCHLASGWDFEWAPSTAQDGGATTIGPVGSPYTVFGPTAINGTTSVVVPLSNIGDRIWVREVLKTGYIPFTGQNTTQDVSAELYCYQDGLNYDNYDFILNPQPNTTYYCVAFNAPKTVTPPVLPPQVCSIVSDEYTDVISYKIGNAPTVSVYASSTEATVTPVTTSAWTASTIITSPAKWIWDKAQETDTTVDKYVTLKRAFTVSDINTSATLTIGADNSFDVFLDSTSTPAIGSQNDEQNYLASGVITINIPSLSVGQHTLIFVVKNWALDNNDITHNPAGLLYKLVLANATCTNDDGPHNPSNNPPAIQLLGNASTTITIGTVFIDPGARATDLEDLGAGHVDYPTTTAGFTVTGLPPAGPLLGLNTYTIDYKYCDSNNACSPIVTRIVNVVAGNTQCSDGINNDSDSFIDSADSGCHTDGDVGNPATYNPADNDENTVVVGPSSPTVDLTSDTSSVTSGSPVVLSWTSTNSTSCSIDSGVGSVAVSGNTTVSPSSTITYTITCTNGSVSTTDSVTIGVTSIPFVVNPPTGGGGGGGGGHRHGGGNQPQGLVLGASTDCGIYLSSYIKLGAKNNPEDVMKLQSFLNEWMGAGVPNSGVYDKATFNALEKFQLKYKNDILEPWVKVGLHKNENIPTGFVYKTTQRQINNIMCPALNLPLPDLSNETSGR